MNLPLSVIIPTKNEEVFLESLLQSIRNQTAQPAEIIVADADSTDRTRAIAKAYGGKVVQGGNHPGIGRNKGAVAATQPLLLFLDADVTMPDNDFLRSAVWEFNKRNLGVACCLAIISSGNRFDRAGVAFINTYFFLTERFMKNGVGYCTLIHKEIHEQIAGFNEQIVITEDQDYVARASKLKKFRYLRSKKIVVSLRRYEQEGRIRLFIKYLRVTWYMLLKIKITEGKIPYSFSHSYIDDSKK